MNLTSSHQTVLESQLQRFLQYHPGYPAPPGPQSSSLSRKPSPVRQPTRMSPHQLLFLISAPFLSGFFSAYRKFVDGQCGERQCGQCTEHRLWLRRRVQISTGPVNNCRSLRHLLNHSEAIRWGVKFPSQDCWEVRREPCLICKARDNVYLGTMGHHHRASCLQIT